jgi:hypothetical protein
MALVIALLVSVHPDVFAAPLFSALSIGYPSGTGAHGVAIGDLNRDGKPDAVTVNGGTGTISVLLNRGDGTLSAPREYPVVCNRVVLADFDGDGVPDVAAGYRGGTFTLLLSDGHGSLRIATRLAGDPGWLIGDINGDGKPDLVGSFNGIGMVRIGVGDGTFLAVPTSPIGGEIASASGTPFGAIGDLNRDGRLDLIVERRVSYGQLDLDVMLGNGDGSFSPRDTIDAVGTSDDYLDGVVVGDVNGDGNPDLIYGLGCSEEYCGTYMYTLFGNGDGTFRPGPQGGGGSPVMVADVDGDGISEVLSMQGGQMQVAARRPDGGFDARSLPVYTHWVDVGDLNGDGRPDMATVSGDPPVMLMMGNGDFTFGSEINRFLGFSPTIVASGDLNGDGRSDLVALNDVVGDVDYPRAPISVLLDDGSGSLVVAGSYSAGAEPLALALGDLNDDGHLDLVVSEASAEGVWALMGDGAGGFGPKTLVWSQAANGVTIGDLNRDGHNDLVLLRYNGGMSLVLGHGDGTFGPSTDYPGNFSTALILDVNRDGAPDIVANADARAVSVMLGDGTGSLGARSDFDVGQAVGNLATGDLNGDGIVDLVATGGSVLSTLLGDGHGGFVLRARVPVRINGPVAVGDLNGDGAEDVAVPMGNSLVAVLPGARDGTLVDPIFLGTAGMKPSWVGITDRNDDGKPDLTVVSGGLMYYSDGNRYYGSGAAVAVIPGNAPSTPPPPPAPAPMPTFIASNVGPASIVLGQTFTITLRVENRGHASDDGRVVVSFPSLTNPADPQWVSGSGGDDGPGYREIAAGGALADSACNSIQATCLAAEYDDAEWGGYSVETNTLTLTVRPQTTGPFYFYVRSTMHDAVGGACAFVNAQPASGQRGFTDQQGWSVARYAVQVIPVPMEPVPGFTSAVTAVGDSLALGESFTISFSAQNNGAATDDGRIVVGFPSFTSPTDSELVSYVKSPDTYAGDSPGFIESPAGSIVSDSLCQSFAASYLEVEYRDSDWSSTEFNRLYLRVIPRAIGTFVFDVRTTMHTVGAPCRYVNAVPAGGAGGFTDQEGWTVRRFAITVLPPKPRPSFTAVVVPSAVTVGYPFTLTATVTNLGPDSDDGRIVVSFPNFISSADTEWVSAAGGDDSPGYHEWPTGSALPLAGCSTIVSNYLSVEYADGAWSGGETNQISLTVTPLTVGTFPIYLRSTLRWSPRGSCAYVNSVPATGAPPSTDQQGQQVGVISVTVVPPPTPPVFAAEVSGMPTSIALGETFTLTAIVHNDGVRSDDARMSIGFPNFTNPADGQWLYPESVNGFLTRPAGATISDSTCHPVTADHLVAESWTTGASKTLTLTVQPQTSGTFYVDVRATFHYVGTTCGYVNAMPPGGMVVTDQQGWSVRRFAITVNGSGDPIPPPSIAWERISVPVAGPVARGGATAIYHPGQQAMIIYGGEGSTDYFGDVWSLSLAAGGGWSAIAPGGPKPIRRILQSMVLSPADNQVVIFGGYYDVFLNDVSVMALSPVPWWFPNPVHGTPPSPRGGHAAVYDPVRNRMIVIGGFGDAMMNDVWECSPPGSGTWHQLTPAGDPMPPRDQATAIYDPVRDRVLMFGGDGGPFFNDVWALNLAASPAWEEIHPTGNPPSPRREHTAIYDPVGDRMIIYGGFDDSRHRGGGVWALNLSGTPTWSLLISSTAPPAARSGHVAIYDEALKRMVMFGGEVGTNQYSSEVWALNLDTTTPVAISLASTEVQSDLVRIAWSADGAQNLKSTVERSEGAGGEWTTVGSATPAGTDRLTFEDRTVVAGTRYGYRLVIAENGAPTISEPVWVTVPVPAILSLTGASPNPSPGAVAVRFSLPGNAAAMLELLDLKAAGSWRARWARRPGKHLVPLSERLTSRPASTWCASPRGPARSPPRPAW